MTADPPKASPDIRLPPPNDGEFPTKRLQHVTKATDQVLPELIVIWCIVCRLRRCLSWLLTALGALLCRAHRALAASFQC